MGAQKIAKHRTIFGTRTLLCAFELVQHRSLCPLRKGQKPTSEYGLNIFWSSFPTPTKVEHRQKPKDNSLQKMLTWKVIWWVSQNIEWFFDTSFHKIIERHPLDSFYAIEKTTYDREDVFNYNSAGWLQPDGNFPKVLHSFLWGCHEFQNIQVLLSLQR